MTNHNIELAAIDRAAAHLLELLERDIDILETLELMRPLIPPFAFSLLCFSIELCPMHICDDRICADDQNPECAAYRL